MKYYDEENVYEANCPQLWRVNTKLGRKRPEFVHYVPQCYNLRAIYFSGQFLNIRKSWCLPPSLTTSLWRHKPQICSGKVLIPTSRRNGDKRIKMTIYRNFEANILIYWFHLSFKIGTWNTILDLDPFLGWSRHHGKSKLRNKKSYLECCTTLKWKLQVWLLELFSWLCYIFFF